MAIVHQEPLPLFDGKTCNGCGVWKPLTSYYRRSDSADGREHKCSQCRIAIKKAWRAENHERLAEQARTWRAGRRERERELQRRWYERNRDRVAMLARERYARKRADGTLRRPKRSGPAHRAKQAASRARRIAMLKDNARKYTEAEWHRMCAHFGNCCLCCGAETELTVDHVVPVVLGGPDVLANIQPLCFTCNRAKSWDKIVDYRDPARLAELLAILWAEREEELRRLEAA